MTGEILSAMTIGLFFGSFNPVHNGHLAIAQYMLAHGGLDELWMVVSPRNPFKREEDLLADEERLRMVQLAVADCDGIRACDVEFGLPRPSYTINTLRYLSETFPDNRFVLIIGSDCLNQFHNWRAADEIIRDYPRLVYPRPGTDPAVLAQIPNGRLVEAEYLDISSTRVRDMIRSGLSVDALLPPSVAAYIREHRLYAAPAALPPSLEIGAE
ncbi:MAG: nicotinate-nucleotide adenylyltransferase [Bacteroidales bacterium]|nr:nicotinate-nucleotide adenylyltransferase [Bacteroidales bacterium]